MNRCVRCNIEIKDETMVCPVCKGILESDRKITVAESVMYPDPSARYEKMKFAIKLCFFLSIVIEGILVMINYITTPEVKWSLITGGAFLYICFTMVYSFQSKSSHTFKLVFQAAMSMVYVVVIDYATGFRGWSYSMAIPIIILIIETAIIVLMIANKKDWQSYIMMQLLIIFAGAWMLVMYILGRTNSPVMAIIAIAVACVMFLGTILFGDNRAITELKRRFHI